ncbi:MAG: methyltransferase [Nanoarchaeota archaeon]|nr:methyltransferase [Nanoarchaeota archaeon]
MHSSIYYPEEDSYLLSEILKKEIKEIKGKTKEKDISVLEIGSGSGIQLETLRKLGIKNITGSDINKKSIQHCKSLGFQCIKSNLFSNIKKSYDLIIFNPPYLPNNKSEPNESKIATTGGKNGSEIINKFLTQAKNHLNKNGKILLITSSLTKSIKWGNWKNKIIARKKLFFEELYLWELKDK